jgi:hypothetical protein
MSFNVAITLLLKAGLDASLIVRVSSQRVKHK